MTKTSKHDLIFYANRSTPQVVPAGSEGKSKEGYGAQTKRRAATEAEEVQIAKGEWVRVDESGNTPSSESYKKTKYRPGLLKKKAAAYPMPDEEAPEKKSIALKDLGIYGAALASIPVGVNLAGHVSQRFLPSDHRELIRAAGPVASSPIIRSSIPTMGASFRNLIVPGAGAPQQVVSRTLIPGVLSYNKDGFNAKGILAHELGHMMNYSDGVDFSNYGKGVGTSGLISLAAGGIHAAANANTEKVAARFPGTVRASAVKHLGRKRYLPLAALSAALPFASTLKEETVASHRGGMLLSGETGNPLDYAKAYMGLPTYFAIPFGGAGLAALPHFDRLWNNIDKHGVKAALKLLVSRGRKV